MSTEAQASTVTWSIDKAHSAVEFAVKHMMFTTVKGTFSELTGTIVEDTADISRSSVETTVEVASVSTRDAKRDEHLRSADFFAAEDHPAITFKSTAVHPIAADRFTVQGDLTIRGTTRSVSLDVTKTGSGVNPWGMQVAGFTATTQINRKEFGLNWNVALEAGGVLVGDTIKISLEIEAAKQS
jgi:polyisoprenoid-binding protein YceI